MGMLRFFESLKVFTDEARTKEVVGQNTLFIGSRAYAQTEWLTPVSTLGLALYNFDILRSYKNILLS